MLVCSSCICGLATFSMGNPNANLAVGTQSLWHSALTCDKTLSCSCTQCLRLSFLGSLHHLCSFSRRYSSGHNCVFSRGSKAVTAMGATMGTGRGSRVLQLRKWVQMKMTPFAPLQNAERCALLFRERHPRHLLLTFLSSSQSRHFVGTKTLVVG